jgi:hypothetical protein
VLLAGGVGLTALACVFSDKTGVAPVFAAFGAVLVILAAFYSRIEGRVQATRDGIAFAVRAARRGAEEQGLPPDEEAEAIERTIGRFEVASRSPAAVWRAAEAAAQEAVESVKLDHQELSRQFARWLTGQGFSETDVAENVPTSDGGEIDLVAKREGEVLAAEVKTTARLIGPGSVFQWLSLKPPEMSDTDKIRRALVIPAEELTNLREGARSPLRTANFEIYGVARDGHVERELP